MFKQQTIIVSIGALLVALALISSTTCKAQDYDDEGYGNQGGGGNNQGEGDNYSNNNNNNNGANYNGNDDGYSSGSNMPNNYQQNVDSEGSNNQPSNYQPQGSASSDQDGDYEGDDGSAAAAASSLSPTVVRVRRSAAQIEEPLKVVATNSEPKLRVKRHGKYNYIGPVYTYVKTDKHANFKWGVKHKVGKKHHG